MKEKNHTFSGLKKKKRAVIIGSLSVRQQNGNMKKKQIKKNIITKEIKHEEKTNEKQDDVEQGNRSLFG